MSVKTSTYDHSASNRLGMFGYMLQFFPAKKHPKDFKTILTSHPKIAKSSLIYFPYTNIDLHDMYDLSGNGHRRMYGKEQIALLRLNTNICTKSCVNAAELLMACRENVVNSIKRLLSQEHIDHIFKKAYLYASCFGHHEVLKLLLKDKRMSFSCVFMGECFMIACKKGHHEIVKLLLSYHILIDSKYTHRGIKQATSYGRANVMKVLLDDDTIDWRPYHFRSSIGSPLRKAIAGEHYMLLKLLLEDGRFKLGDSLFRYSLYCRKHRSMDEWYMCGHTETMFLLYQHPQYDPNITPKERLKILNEVPGFGHLNALILKDKPNISLDEIEEECVNILTLNLKSGDGFLQSSHT